MQLVIVDASHERVDGRRWALKDAASALALLMPGQHLAVIQ